MKFVDIKGNKYNTDYMQKVTLIEEEPASIRILWHDGHMETIVFSGADEASRIFKRINEIGNQAPIKPFFPQKQNQTKKETGK